MWRIGVERKICGLDCQLFIIWATCRTPGRHTYVISRSKLWFLKMARSLIIMTKTRMCWDFNSNWVCTFLHFLKLWNLYYKVLPSISPTPFPYIPQNASWIYISGYVSFLIILLILWLIASLGYSLETYLFILSPQ